MALARGSAALMSPEASTIRAGTSLLTRGAGATWNGQNAYGVMVWSTGLNSGALARRAWTPRQ